MEVRLFDGIGAWSGGVEIDLGGPKQRQVFALLALAADRVVTVDRIIDVVWADEPPDRADVSVRGYVSNLRRIVARDEPDVTVRWRDRGYVLSGPIVVDVVRFEGLLAQGRADVAAGDLASARSSLDAALELWRGPPLGAHAGTMAVDDMMGRWHEMRSEVIERLFDVRLALGEHRSAVAELRAAVAEYPFSEHLRVQLALALYRSDRAVEALRSVQTARRTLIDDVGVVPGPELRDIEARIHAEDPTLGWSESSIEARMDDPDDTPVHAVTTRLWGRGRELATLTDALAAVPAGGTGRALVVSGEPGIGKTTLVEQLTEAARQDGLVVAWGRCRESAAGAPYWPWASIAAALAASNTTGRVGAEIAEVLDLAGTNDAIASHSSSPQLAIQNSIRVALGKLTRTCVVVVDDLQWADTASLELLEFLSNDLADLLLGVVVTVRAGEAGSAVTDCLAELSRSFGSVRLELEGLTRDAVNEWVRSELGLAASEPIATRIHDRTDGNPFFVREVLALLASDPDRATIEEAAARELPAAVHDVVRRRMSRLAVETQRLLSVASILGRDVETDLLVLVSALPSERVLTLLEPALDAGLMYVEASRPGVLRFAHALVVDALLAELNPLRRAALHRSVVSAIEERRAGRLDDVVVQLAFHSFAGATAGGVAKAIDYSLLAAAAASRSHAAHDAIPHLERAIALVDIDGDDGRRRAAVLTELGVAQFVAGDVAVGRATLLAAAELAEALDDTTTVVRALSVVNADDLWTSLDWGEHDPAAIAILERTFAVLAHDDHAGRAALLGALAGQTYHLDPDRSSQVASEAVTAAERVDDPRLLFRVLLQQYWAEWRPHRNPERTDIAARMVSIANHADLPPGSTAVAHLAGFTVAYELGDGDTCDRHLRLARASADPIRTPAAWSYVLYADASNMLLRGDFDDAEHTIEELHGALLRSRRFIAATTRAGLRLQLLVEQGRTDEALDEVALLETSIYASPIAWFRAWALAEGGRLADTGRALRAFDGDIPNDWLKIPLLTAGVSAAAATGDVAFLRQHAERLRPYAHMLACTGSGGIVLGPVALALANAHAALGDQPLAADYLTMATEMTIRMRAAPWIERIERSRRSIEGA